MFDKNYEISTKYPMMYNVLRKMGEVININIDEIDLSNEKWFMDYSWDGTQENEFIEWLSEELDKNKALRAELTNSSIKRNTKEKRNIINMFIFQYGWRKELKELDE